MEWLYFIVCVLVVGACGIAIHNYIERKRTEAWVAVARQNNLAFREKGGGVPGFPNFKLHGKGTERRVYNVLEGEFEGDLVSVFDYNYTVVSRHLHKGRTRTRRTTYRQTLCVINSKELHLCPFFLRPEFMVFDFLGSLFGGQDFDFSEDPEFSKSFVLQGESESAVRALFNPKVRRAFMQFKGAGIQVEGQGSALLFNAGKRINPSEARMLIMKVVNVKRALLQKSVTG